MTHKWLSSDYDQALERCIESLMEGKTICKLTAPEIIGNYQWTEILSLYLQGKTELANREAERCLEHFLCGEGSYIVQSEMVDREAAHVDYLIDRKNEAFA